MKAQLNNYRQAPRKVRLITSLVQGKSAAHAQAILATLIKYSNVHIVSRRTSRKKK